MKVTGFLLFAISLVSLIGCNPTLREFDPNENSRNIYDRVTLSQEYYEQFLHTSEVIGPKNYQYVLSIQNLFLREYPQALSDEAIESRDAQYADIYIYLIVEEAQGEQRYALVYNEKRGRTMYEDGKPGKTFYDKPTFSKTIHGVWAVIQNQINLKDGVNSMAVGKGAYVEVQGTSNKGIVFSFSENFHSVGLKKRQIPFIFAKHENIQPYDGVAVPPKPSE